MARWTAAATLACIMAALLWFVRPGETPEQIYDQGLHLLRTGDFEGAAEHAVRGGRQSDAAAWRCRFRLLESEALLERGRADAALALLEPGCEADSTEYAIRSRVLRARAMISKADLSAAGQLLNEAQQFAADAGQPALRAEVDLLLGQTHARQRRIDRAEALFLSAREAAASAGDRYRMAAAVNNLGMVRMIQSRCEEAIPLFKEAQSLYQAAGASHWVAAAANNVGLCYSQLGDAETAFTYRQTALNLSRPGVLKANALGEAGSVLLVDHPSQAIALYRQACDMAREFGARSDAARWAGNLASAQADVGDFQAARASLREAWDLGPEPRSRMFLELTEAEIATGQQRFEEARSIFGRVIDSSRENPSVLWQAHAGIAAAWAAEDDTERAARSYEQAIRIVEEAQSDLTRNEHKITFLARLIRFYQRYVDLLMARGDVAGALAVADRSRARILSERMARRVPSAAAFSGRRFREVAKRSGGVWLSYWLAPRRSFLWVVTADDIRSFHLPPEPEIAALTREYRAFIETALRDPMQTRSEAGRRLYDLLIAPAAPQIPASESMVVIPDGALHRLSFDTLPVYDNGAPRYLTDDAAIAITPAFGVHRELRAGPIRARDALIIGNPVSPGPAYPPLSNAEREIAGIAKHMASQRTRVVTGAEARPAVWHTAQPGLFSMVHIAAHAEANERSPLDSAIILTNDRGYRLYARDIIDVPLRAELVSLSACRSSGARAYAGEGMVGLAWAFLHAGARSVVAGLWDVADEPASMVMDDLYRRIAAGEAPDSALRNAKLSVRGTGYAKPYYWAAFQYYTR